MEWYCIVTGTQRGPMPLADLAGLIRGGTLRPDDYVWNESFGEQWRRVRDVPELAPSSNTPMAAVAVAPGTPAAAGPAPAPEAVRVAQPVLPAPLTGVPGRRPSFALAMQQAWDHMVLLLFRGSSFARWMGMAFCVWISIVGLHEPNLTGEILARHVQPDQELLTKLQASTASPEQTMACYQELLNQMWEKAQNLLTPGIIETVLCVWLGLLVITGWLRARGAFMVMHRWHHPDDTIAQSWAAGRRISWSLFFFRLAFGTVMCALTVVIGLDLHMHVLAPVSGGSALEGALRTHGFLLLLGLSVLLTVWLTVSILVTHFVVPIMYWRRVGLLAAWRTVVEFCNERPGAMTVYFTMYLVLLHVLLAALMLLFCCTCCCARFLLIIPFVNGILLLPATIFLRGLGISFLRQWRPDLEMAGR